MQLFLCSFVDVPFNTMSAFFCELKMEVKELLERVLEFFENERDGKARISLTMPMERLAEGTGLDRFQIYLFYTGRVNLLQTPQQR